MKEERTIKAPALYRPVYGLQRSEREEGLGFNMSVCAVSADIAQQRNTTVTELTALLHFIRRDVSVMKREKIDLLRNTRLQRAQVQHQESWLVYLFIF